MSLQLYNARMAQVVSLRKGISSNIFKHKSPSFTYRDHISTLGNYCHETSLGWGC